MKRLRMLFALFVASLSLGAPAFAASPNVVVHLAATPVAAREACPAIITFKGVIATSNWSPTALRRVQYRFIRSDGANAPIQTITFPTVAGGSKAVSTTWMLGASYSGWEAIQILYPQSMQSNHAMFHLTCLPKPMAK